MKLNRPMSAIKSRAHDLDIHIAGTEIRAAQMLAKPAASVYRRNSIKVPAWTVSSLTLLWLRTTLAQLKVQDAEQQDQTDGIRCDDHEVQLQHAVDGP